MEQKIAFTKNKKSWINQNIDLVTQHRGEWIGISETKGLIAAAKDFEEFEKQLKNFKGKYRIWFVNENMGKRQVLMVRGSRRNIWSISDDSHYWEPMYAVDLKNGKQRLSIFMIVDSASDLTMIPFEAGLKLGFKKDVADLRLKGHGVSGSFTFLSKEIDCIIDGRQFKLPIAWVQDVKSTHLILGREVVFDLFDIEFKQAEETIDFKWRGK